MSTRRGRRSSAQSSRKTKPARPKARGGITGALKQVAPGLTNQQRQALMQLRAKDAEIQAWFRADPTRLAQLQKNPKQIAADLAKAIGLKLTPAKSLSAKNMPTIVRDPFASPLAMGPSPLMAAVWRHVMRSKQNQAAWRKAPVRVIEQVAKATRANSWEVEAVVAAYRKASGTTTRVADLLPPQPPRSGVVVR
jgi:hypothetical protein